MPLKWGQCIDILKPLSMSLNHSLTHSHQICGTCILVLLPVQWDVLCFIPAKGTSIVYHFISDIFTCMISIFQVHQIRLFLCIYSLSLVPDHFTIQHPHYGISSQTNWDVVIQLIVLNLSLRRSCLVLDILKLCYVYVYALTVHQVIFI